MSRSGAAARKQNFPHPAPDRHLRQIMFGYWLLIRFVSLERIIVPQDIVEYSDAKKMIVHDLADVKTLAYTTI